MFWLHPSGHKSKDCFFHAHPDFNKDAQPWVSSAKGQKWAAKGKSQLPATRDLEGHVVELPQQVVDRHKGTKPKSSTGESNLLPCIIATPNCELHVQALVDTGSQENFINANIAERLKTLGLRNIKQQKLTLCSAFTDSCNEHDIETFCIKVLITNEITNKLSTFNLTAHAASLAHDLIIGRNSIKTFKLTKVIPSHFEFVGQDDAGVSEADHLNPNERSTTAPERTRNISCECDHIHPSTRLQLRTIEVQGLDTHSEI